MTPSPFRLWATALLCVWLLPVFAQKNDKIKFGKIDPDQVAMTQYEADPFAEAVILYEKQRVSFTINHEGLVLTYDVHRRVKILTSSAEDYANVEVSYLAYKNQEEISSLRAMSYNMEDGELVSQKMEREAIFEEAENEFVNKISFAVPNVKEGSVIEYSYRKISQRLGTIPAWHFQHEIPTMYSELSFDMPDGFNYQRMYRGEPIESLVIEEETYRPDFMQEQGYRYRYTAVDVPAMKEEPYTTSIYNFVGRLQFELQGIYLPQYSLIKDYNTTWKQLDETCQQSSSYVSYLNNKNLIAEMFQSIGITESPEEFVSRASRYIRKNFQWSGYRGIYPSQLLKEMPKEDKTNGAGMNLLLIALARHAGYDAYPVLMSTRKHGAVQTTYPLFDQFNHMIAKIQSGDVYYLVDLTDPFCPLGTLPYADLNSIGLVLDGSGSNWVKLTSDQKTESELRGNFTLGEDGTLKGNVVMIDKGYQAISWRKRFYANEEDEEAYIQARMIADMPSALIEDVRITNLDTLANPLRTECTLTTTDFVNASGDFLYLQPLMFSTQDENPFKLEKRSYPVDFGAGIEDRVSIIYNLPEGYEVETMPEPVRAALPEKGASFTYQVQHVGSMVQVISFLSIDKTMFNAEEYPDVRAFYDFVVKKHGEQLVLRKKS